MPVDSALVRVLAQAAGEGATPPDAESLVRRRRGRTRRLTGGLVALSAAAVVAVALLATALVPSRPAPAATPARPVDALRGWTVLPAAPLSPRSLPVTVSVGTQALVIGGDAGPVCPPNADCVRPAGYEALRDGAAYDVATGRWHRLADAPLPIYGGRPAVVAGVVHLLVGRDGTHLGYDVAADRWSRLPDPPGSEGHRPTALVAAGDRLIAYSGVTDRPDLLYDPAARTWSALPKSPLEPAFDRQYVWTGRSLVLLAAADVPQPGGASPSFQRAAVLDLDSRRWRLLPDATGIVSGSFAWSWDGSRVVSPSRFDPYGGRAGRRLLTTSGALDPVTGRWARLPPGPPEGTQPESDVAMASSRRYKADGNALFDTALQRWVQVLAAPPEVGPYSGQTWVGDALLVWGGARRRRPGRRSTGRHRRALPALT